MTKDDELNELSKEEDKLKSYWKNIIERLKTDNGKIELAYIWTDEVKRDFEGIKTEAGKLAFFLKRLHLSYKTNEQKYYKAISHIKILLLNLKKIKADAGWLKEIRMELEEIIRAVEGEKVDIPSLKEKISRRDFLRFAGRAAAATAVALTSSKIPFLLPSADAAERKKYLSYEELMKLVNKYNYVYHNSNIKPGQVPRIILFGEKHRIKKEKYDFLEEFFGLVDKEKKNLAVLFEEKGDIGDFKLIYEAFPIKHNALYFGIDTHFTLEESLKYFADEFEWLLLFAFVNEATERLTKIWQNRLSAGYKLLKMFNIGQTKGYSQRELTEKLYDRIHFVDKNIKEYHQKRDETMMRNTIDYIKKFPNYQFFMIVGASHVDTYGDKVKENDRFSQFFNQNKISYFSILEVSESEKEARKFAAATTRFEDIVKTDYSSVYSITLVRKVFCKVYNIDEQLFFRLAKEK